MYKVLFVATILIVGCIPIIIAIINKRKDNNIKFFYKACDDIRNRVRALSNRSEASELLDDIDFVRDTFRGLVHQAVLDKELKLLGNLINKQSKKLK